jgi:Cu/Ag efflux pump CusA
MLNKIIEFSLHNRFLVLIFTAILVGSGIYSVLRLPIDAVPDLTNVQVQVLTNAPSLGPLEVEQYITFPVETAMSGLPRVEEIRSVSRIGLSAVTVIFEEGTDIYWARSLVLERLSQARDAIPEGYGEPEMAPISSGLGEIFQFEVRGEGYSLMELRTVLDWYVGYQLKTVPGLVEVNSFGGELKTYEVQVDPERLLNYGISMDRVFEALRSNNANQGGGYIVHYDEQRIVRGQGLIKSLDELGDVVLASREDGTPIHVSDVAEVRFAPMLRQGAVTRDGRGEAVTGICMMLMGENARVVAERVKAEIERIEPSLPPGVTIEVFYDRTDLVFRTIMTVLKNLSEGGLLVIVVLFLLLGNLRAGLVVAFAIPLAMFFAIDNMVYWGIAGSLMSLGAIDFGLVVDSSVIMIENCVRRLSGHGPPEDEDRPLLDVVRDAAIEVRKPTMFGELIIAIVYLPILALQGMEGKLFRPMALTVIFALFGSMVLSLTLMPVLASLALRRPHDPINPALGWCRRHRVLTALLIAAASVGLPLGLVLWNLGVPASGLGRPLEVLTLLREHLPTEELILLLIMPAVLLGLALTAVFLGGPVQEKEVFLVRWAGAVYQPVLRRVLLHPVLTFATTAAIFGASLWVAKDLGAEFMPKLDEGAVALQAWRLPSVSLEKSIADTTQIERVLKAFPEVETVVSRTGRAEIATDPMGVEISDIIVMLIPQEEWTTLESPENLARVMQGLLKSREPADLRRQAEEIFAEFGERNLFNPKDRLVMAFDELLNAVVPGNVFSYSQPIELRVQELVAGVRSDLGISLYGDDLDLLKRKGDEIVAVLQTIPGAAEAKAQQIAGLPVLRVDVDRDAIARYGVNASDVLDAVGAIGGKVVGQIFEGQRRFALQVRFPADVRQDLEALRRIKVADPRGRQIPLEQLASLTIEQGPLQIFRQKIRRRQLIECNVRGRDVATFVAEAQRRITEEVDLPPGYSLHWGGQFENLVSASRRLAIVVPLALGLIFILLYSTFNSARLAALIYLAVPMAAIGGIFALALRGMPFSISAGVGFIALFGVAVLNGLVLVSYAEHIREGGAGPNEAAFEAGRVRLRPVLTTALVASLGFLPMALATSAGAEVQRPLATVVIGGLISSTLLTLLVVPAIYHWFVPPLRSAQDSGPDPAH